MKCARLEIFPLYMSNFAHENKMSKLHKCARKIVLCVLYFSIPIFLYISLFKGYWLDKIHATVIIFTVISLLVIANENFKMNAAHASILFVCSLFYGFFADIHMENHYTAINLLLSIAAPSSDVTNIVIGEIYDNIISCIFSTVLYGLPGDKIIYNESCQINLK